ncbi:MAG TPA: hypothetical protein VI072_19650 [Polyangiaceae bacterium]
MTPPTLVTLIWLGVAPRHSTHDVALSRFAAAHHVRFQNAASTEVPGAERLPEYNPALALEIEGLLEKARLSAGALDDTAALAHVGAVEQLLRAHAELPQAAWLMAERLQIEASVLERRPAEQARAQRLRSSARALEGERAPVYRPAPPASAGPGSTQANTDSAVSADISVGVSGLRRSDVLEWNGQSRRPPLRVAAGLHHLRILRHGELVAARWLEVAPGAADLVVATPEPAPCSAADLAPVGVAAGRITTPETRCRSWAVARPAGAATVEIALCRGARCGGWTRWPPHAGPERHEATKDERSWQTWAPYALGGLAAIATTGIVLWRLGAFDRDEPEDRVVFTGPSALSF